LEFAPVNSKRTLFRQDTRAASYIIQRPRIFERGPMTATAPSPHASAAVAPVRPVNLLLLLVASPLVWIAPRAIGRLWLRASLWQSFLLAVLHTSVGAMIVSRNLPTDIAAMDYWHHPFTRVESVMLLLMVVGGFLSFLVMLGFAIIPFVPLPGPSRSAIRHVIRTILLGTTMVYLWAAAFCLARPVSDGLMARYEFGDTVLLWLALGAGLLVWAYVSLVSAATIDYRRPQDVPAPREPRCDDCGYDIHTIPLDSRCPECGKPVMDCLGDYVRPPTPWERKPSFMRLGLVCRQFFTLTFRPLSLFRVMPITTGHAAARRWLCLTIGLVFVEAFWVAPTIYLIDRDLNVSAMEWQTYAAGFTTSVAWAFLALMMVGIETAGVTAVSRYRKQPIDMAAASKVTCYASTPLFFWVILGIAQADLLFWWVNLYHGPARYGDRMDSFFTITTFGIAHIGGLLLFEMTVYRGLRAVMYAIR